MNGCGDLFFAAALYEKAGGLRQCGEGLGDAGLLHLVNFCGRIKTVDEERFVFYRGEYPSA